MTFILKVHFIYFDNIHIPNVIFHKMIDENAKKIVRLFSFLKFVFLRDLESKYFVSVIKKLYK